MNNRRKFTRRQLLFYPEVKIRGTDYLLGKVADVSHTGMLLLAEKAVETGVEFPLQIDLPKTIYRKENIYFEAEILRCRLDRKSGHHEIGISFTEMSEQDKLVLNRLILDYRLT